MYGEPKVAIIILNWNGINDTIECLESLKYICYSNYRIVLVDNGSNNEEGKRLAEMFPHIHCIQNEVNRGFAGGNNDAINWCLENGFEYIVNLNNDCVVDKKWLVNLIRGLKKQNADFASSRIMFYQNQEEICSFNDELLPDLSKSCINCYERYLPSNRIENIIIAPGAASIYSTKCLKSVLIKGNQFFDELHFAYGEDIDLGLRLGAKLYKGVCVPEAVVYHKGSKSSGELSAFAVFQTERNRLLNELLNYPLPLICLGEIYFFLKLFVSGIYAICYRDSKANRYMKNINVFSMFLLFIKARIWIIANLQLIVKNRKDRRIKELLNYKIYKNFYWNLFNTLK